MTDKKIESYEAQLSLETRNFVQLSIEKIVKAKETGEKVVVILGSGPNLHEGVTTLMAELMNKGVVDGLSTSSAVISHELAGVLDKVKRVNGVKLGINKNLLPKGEFFEITQLPPQWLDVIDQEMNIDYELMQRGNQLEGDVIIKAAGNMGYPMGLRSERIAKEILGIARAYGVPFETAAGWGADPHTMIGSGARKRLPVLVSVPQLIGGGGVGLCIGDSISITERCMKMAQMLGSADVLIESAVALTQEIHDGPFETYTGHGVWGYWDGYKSYSLENKTLIRIDLDPNLKRAWDMQRQDSSVQNAINKGLPKTKLTGIPFRMEMSGFARLETSIPVVGDIGVVWPVIAWHVAERLKIELDFINHPQQTEEGQKMREWIVDEIHPFDREQMIRIGQSYQ
ncbi:MAG: hypothetical protein GYA18_07405 [Chloroflexi bacterium]|nr:hypothetical protein [Chloroflexota bacterium]